MSDWIHSLACDWGHWMRKAAAKDGAISGTLGRIMEEGADGAAIRSHGQKIPVTDFPEKSDVGSFHRAWLMLEPHHQCIIFVDYRMREPIKKKFELMGKKKDAYYRARRKALDVIGQQVLRIR